MILSSGYYTSKQQMVFWDTSSPSWHILTSMSWRQNIVQAIYMVILMHYRDTDTLENPRHCIDIGNLYWALPIVNLGQRHMIVCQKARICCSSIISPWSVICYLGLKNKNIVLPSLLLKHAILRSPNRIEKLFVNIYAYLALAIKGDLSHESTCAFSFC